MVMQNRRKRTVEVWTATGPTPRSCPSQPLSAHTQIAFTTPVKAFFKYLANANHILYNPASELDMPRVEKRLPRHILNVKEVEVVLAVPDLATPIGIRDRAILEPF